MKIVYTKSKVVSPEERLDNIKMGTVFQGVIENCSGTFIKARTTITKLDFPNCGMEYPANLGAVRDYQELDVELHVL